jgi:hypothetical protein
MWGKGILLSACIDMSCSSSERSIRTGKWLLGKANIDDERIKKKSVETWPKNGA